MVTTHNLGFPRIGAKRELKRALELYWRGGSEESVLLAQAAALRAAQWQAQSELDLVPIGDFSLYDQVLDMSVVLGTLAQRVRDSGGSPLQQYFRAARGRAPGDTDSCAVEAGEMTKWFDTNYHYIVPEFDEATRFELNPQGILEAVGAARVLGIAAKPVLLGPVSYLWLGKSRDGSDRLALLPRLLPVYAELLRALAEAGLPWVQLDEPALVTELAPNWQTAYQTAYAALGRQAPNLLLTTYFGPLDNNLELALSLPTQGLHLDAVAGRSGVAAALDALPDGKVLSLGVVGGRNVWKTDLTRTLNWLEPVRERLGERLWLAPSCSLLHVPVDLEQEHSLDPEVKSWMSFARQKVTELATLGQALNSGRASVAAALQANAAAIASREHSPRVRDERVRARVSAMGPTMGQRTSPYAARAKAQATRLRLPLFPTTTIGSFPQTEDMRRARRQYRAGKLEKPDYVARVQGEIRRAVREQEALGLDVLVHGEAERNDMVEYFGELLTGYALTAEGWVQSYGSRCVKPPILYGDISRPRPMTVEWTAYASSLTNKPMKGMLTGPVTILNWSFVRDDQPRRETCRQLALAVRDEVLDLERQGVAIIQIDEAALREGLPLRRSEWAAYLAWAVEAFRIAASGVRDETQIHTHMCYSEFNDIIEAIASMDADVITIETSRSGTELLRAFETFAYPNQIGPGVYDIHSPNTPSEASIASLLRRAQRLVPKERLWVNPDCGLKTRRWEEVLPALRHMVSAAAALRDEARQDPARQDPAGQDPARQDPARQDAARCAPRAS